MRSEIVDRGQHAEARPIQATVSWLVIGVLLFLRLPFLTGLSYFVQSDLAWLDPAYQIATYALTAWFIWWWRDRLADFHIDSIAIVIMLLFKPLETLILPVWGIPSPLAFPNWPALSLWAIAIVTFLALRKSPLPRVRRRNLAGVLIGAGAGVGTALIMAYLFLPLSTPGQGVSRLEPMMLLGFPYQLGYAAIDEEPLFRGFLWGQLRKAGWREGAIWLAQAALFALGHLPFLERLPLPYFLFNFLGLGLVFGLLAWRSRSIATSMVAHAAYNASAPLMSYVVSLLGS
jgi:membrane protease YdiL (CAAX protease family)